VIVLYILGLILMGLLVGALARLLIPGRDPMTIPETILVGIGGSLVAGLIAWFLFDHSGAGFLLSLLCAMVLVYIVRKVRERNTVGGTVPRR
jgi:uncharacterized membrane protein YeaQ/YmgE (transglycosylase-associated protein family)